MFQQRSGLTGRKQHGPLGREFLDQQFGKRLVAAVLVAGSMKQPAAQHQRQQACQEPGAGVDRRAEDRVPVAVSGDLPAFGFQGVTLVADLGLIGSQFALQFDQLAAGL